MFSYRFLRKWRNCIRRNKITANEWRCLWNHLLTTLSLFKIKMFCIYEPLQLEMFKMNAACCLPVKSNVTKRFGLCHNVMYTALLLHFIVSVLIFCSVLMKRILPSSGQSMLSCTVTVGCEWMRSCSIGLKIQFQPQPWNILFFI